jgi:hypothetical protein
MKIKPIIFGILVVLVFLGIIFGFQQAGVWTTSGKVNASGGRVEPSAGDANTIKGWMTLEQVSTAYNIPVSEILAEFDLPADTPPGTALKDLEGSTFDIPSLRAWLQAFQPVAP